MTRQGLIWLLIALVVVISVAWTAVIRDGIRAKRYATTIMTYSVGRELIEKTNSSLITTMGPELRAQLCQLLASTTHIASVRLGDEPAPVGDGRAFIRLVLTNDLAHGLGIRLRVVSRSVGQSQLEPLGFWSLSVFQGETNWNQSSTQSM